MEIQIIKEDKNLIEIEVKGETHTLTNLVRSELWNVDDVAIASYNLKHPVVSNPILILKTKSGKPKKALSEAVSNLKAKTKELRALAKKL